MVDKTKAEAPEVTDELEKRIKELERLNGILVGRELRMVELKKENAQLKKLLESKKIKNV